MNLCLFVLALIDIVYLLYCMIFTVAYWMRIFDPALGEEFYQKTLFYAGGVCSGLRETSTSVSVLIAVERCVCVVFPLRANSFMTTRTMGILLAAIVVGMQLAFIMTPLKRYVFPVYDNTTGMTMWKVARSATWQDNEALLLYDTVDDTIMLITFPFVMFILVSGATAITVVKLRAAMSWRLKKSSVRSEARVSQVALTRMLVLASYIFVASKVPVITVSMARLIYSEFSTFGKQYNAFKLFDLIVNFLPYAHCAVSFFVYYSMSSRFRSELRVLCGCSCRRTYLKDL
ncbi:uncharacterized protein LOC112565949 [Pomacea canaliculata]|uniref:uncharacterized protein LOC112565949 n=1 Tax=Pomacea canaliculata TaxID=400727 RepID=UPI000D739D60|nr:uncharacterized protein LOC112565949 [Pomacea canaliculata]